jgi:TRAP transporter TAXI family solute receptor
MRRWAVLYSPGRQLRSEAHMLRALLLLGLVLFSRPSAASELRLFTFGSGEVGGGYFVSATALCEAVNRAHRGVLRCSPEATPGSLCNLTSLRDGQLDFALTQSDWQKAAYEGSRFFGRAGPISDLRAVMSLYPEAITILARSGSGIARFSDLPGKRVDIGPPASGRRATASRLLGDLGLDRTDFAALRELPTDNNFGELCAGRVDAAILVVGHPSEAVRNVMQRCGATLVSVTGARIDAVLRESPDFVPVTIPAGEYPGLAADVPTYAVIATVVVREDVPSDLVQALVTATLDDLDQLALRAPVLAGLEPTEMRSRGLTVPLHPAALEAFGAHAAKP